MQIFFIYKRRRVRLINQTNLVTSFNQTVKMKSILCLLVFAAAASQISAKLLNVTVFYGSLCPDCRTNFQKQIWPTYQDKEIRDKVYIELVPFGKGSYTEKPWNITCHHGPRECEGNARDACFMARHTDNYKQVAFVSCCMSEPDPPTAGEKCAKKLGYSYEGVKECTFNKEGIALQIKHARRTLDFPHKVTFIPTIVYNNVYNDKDQKESLTNFRAVVLRKLKEMGSFSDEE